MKFIGNVFWFLLTGFASAIMWFFLGLGWCLTLVGIPFGIQAFKFAKLSLAPFGKNINKVKSRPIANVIWFIFGGFGLALTFFFTAIVWCVSIIGIPFGIQAFKLAKLSVAPFGKEIA